MAVLDITGQPTAEKPQEPPENAQPLVKIGYAANRVFELSGQMLNERNAYAINRAHDRLNECLFWLQAAASTPSK